MTINVVYNIKLSTESDLKKQNCILKKMIERRSYGCLQVAVLVTKTPSLSDVIKLHMQLFYTFRYYFFSKFKKTNKSFLAREKVGQISFVMNSKCSVINNLSRRDFYIEMKKVKR